MKYMICSRPWDPTDPTSMLFKDGNFVCTRTTGNANGDYFTDQANNQILCYATGAWTHVTTAGPGCFFQAGGSIANFSANGNIVGFFFQPIPGA